MKPPTLGQIPLEYLDFVVDSKNRKRIPNPEHGDKQGDPKNIKQQKTNRHIETTQWEG